MSYTFYKILTSEVIGNSLSSINLNYYNLNNWVNDVQLNYENKIKPLMDFYNTYINDMESTISLVNELSSSWNDFKTTVQSNSSFWIQPVSIIYPKIFPFPFVDNYLKVITSWVNEKYPTQNTSAGITNYIENETIIVNVYTYQETVKIDSKEYKSDVVTCYTNNGTVCADCATYWWGSVNCHQGTFNCNHTVNCKNCVGSNCSYTLPYYNIRGSGIVYADSKIDANVNMYFKDRWEDENIKSISFKVVDCKWVFDKFIGA
jgi:hypothetical protein